MPDSQYSIGEPLKMLEKGTEGDKTGIKKEMANIFLF